MYLLTPIFISGRNSRRGTINLIVTLRKQKPNRPLGGIVNVLILLFAQPSNVLIDSACHVKLCDFGLARSIIQPSIRELPEDEPAPLTEYVATRWYRAPEILLASGSYTKSIDIWSLGCILGEMLVASPLFPGSSTIDQLEKIVSAMPCPLSLSGK